MSLILATVGVLMFIGIYWSVTNACTFVGFVRSPSFTNQTIYTNEMDHWKDRAYDVWNEHGHNNAGWSLYGYAGNPPAIYPDWIRQTGDFSPWSDPEYIPHRDGAWNWGATVVVAHYRQANAEHHSGSPDMHPFVYDYDEEVPAPYQYYRMFGKPYSFMHNGTVQQGGASGLANRTAVGFCALDIFHHREWAAWFYPTTSNDTEHYAMMLMKYLMAQENYYWDGPSGPSNTPPVPNPQNPIQSTEEWAIRKVLQDSSVPGLGDSWNGILTDGSSMWAIAK